MQALIYGSIFYIVMCWFAVTLMTELVTQWTPRLYLFIILAAVFWPATLVGGFLFVGGQVARDLFRH